MFKEKKQIYGYRKNKATKNLCGAVLGSLVFAVTMNGENALATEDVNSTNLTEKKKEFDNLAKTTEGITATSMEIKIEYSPELKAKIEEAKEYGIKVIPNTEENKEVTSLQDFEAAKEEVKNNYNNAIRELTALIEKQKNLNGSESEKLVAYKQKMIEYKQAKDRYEKYLKDLETTGKENQERYEREYAQYLKDKAKFEKDIKEYAKAEVENYSYLYALAIEEAVKDENDTANIWNVEIVGGTPLETESFPKNDGSAYYRTYDPAYWEGKEATTYKKGRLANVDIYSVKLQKGETITVRYSKKDGTNLKLNKVFETEDSITTDVKYVEYTYTMNDTVNATGTEIIHIANDANIPIYRGNSDYTQMDDYSGKKSQNMKPGGVNKTDLTIRALSNEKAPLRMRMLIRGINGEQNVFDYIDTPTEFLFTNSSKTTKVAIPKNENSNNLTEEHGTEFSKDLVDITTVPHITNQPDWKEKYLWNESWSGMLNTSGTGIKHRTFEYPNPTIKASNDEPNATTTTKRYRMTSNKIITTDSGETIPGVRLINYDDVTQADSEFRSKFEAKYITPDFSGFKLVVDNPYDFYNNYIQKGKNLKVVYNMSSDTDTKTDSFVWNLDEYRGMLEKDLFKDKETTITLKSTPEKTYVMDNVKLLDTTTNTEAVGLSIENYNDITKATNELKSNFDNKYINDRFSGFIIKADNPEAFYKEYIQKGKNIKVVYNMRTADGETKQDEFIWDLSEYRNMLEAEAFKNIEVTFTDADGNSTVRKVSYDEYKNMKARGEITTESNVSFVGTFKFFGVSSAKVGGGGERTVSYDEYMKLKAEGLITESAPQFTDTFKFYGIASASATSITSGWAVGAREGVSSIASTRSEFHYERTTPPNVPTPPKPPTPINEVPEPGEEPEPPTPTDGENVYELPPSYRVMLSSNIEKLVKNTNNENIHGKQVAKGSDVVWELTTEDLPAGRKVTTSYVFSDVMPEGFEVNLEEVKKQNPLYDVDYNVNTRKLTISAKQSTLDEWNRPDESIPVESSVYTINMTPNKETLTSSDAIFTDWTFNYFNFNNSINNQMIPHVNNTNKHRLEPILNSSITFTPKNMELDKYEYFRKRGLISEFTATTENRVIDAATHKVNFIIPKDNIAYLLNNTIDKKHHKAWGENGELYKLVYNDTTTTYTWEKIINPLTRKPITKDDLNNSEDIKYDNLTELVTSGLDEINFKFIPYGNFSKFPWEDVEKRYIEYINNNTPSIEDPSKPQIIFIDLNDGFVDGTVADVNNTTLYPFKLLDLNTLPMSEIEKEWTEVDLLSSNLYSNVLENTVDKSRNTYKDYIEHYPKLKERLEELARQGYKVIVNNPNKIKKEATANSSNIDDYVGGFINENGVLYIHETKNHEIDWDRENAITEYINTTPEKTYTVSDYNYYTITVPQNKTINTIKRIDTYNNGEVKETVIEPSIYNSNKKVVDGNDVYIVYPPRDYALLKSSRLDVTLGDDNITGNVVLKTIKYIDKDNEVETGKQVNTIANSVQNIRLAKVTPPKIIGKVLNDAATYENNFVLTINNGNTDEGGSVTSSNIVRVRTTPPKPTKENRDQNGVDINRTPRVIGSTNYYTLNWDLDQYKDIVATEDTIQKGFYYIDDYPEEAVKPNEELITYKLLDGTPVTGIQATKYNSVEEAPQEIKDMLNNANITSRLKGAFQVFKVLDPVDFYNKYVKTGKNIKIVTPMTVRGDVPDIGTYKNNAFQVDFGNGYYTNEVANYVVKPEPKKVNRNAEGININGKTMPINSDNYYNLTWDLDQFKGIVLTEDVINKGFYMVDDYPEDALDIVPDGTRIYTTDDEQPVTGVSVHIYNSLAEAPENIRKAFESTNYQPNGRIQVFTADNPVDFYNNYVLTGKNINIETKMRVKPELKNQIKEYRNTAYQLNFGSATATDTTVNTTPSNPNPTKEVKNKENVDINGKQVVAGSTIDYKLHWNLEPYSNIAVTLEEVDKGFYFFDDFPDEALIPTSTVKITDNEGNTVEDILYNVYSSIDNAPKEIQDLFKANNITIKGAFQVFKANSTVDFYNKYVSKGKNLTISNPMKVKEELKNRETTFINTGYQSEFGIINPTNDVTNITVKPDPEKQVLNKNAVNIDNTMVPVGSTNIYVLTWDLDQYKGFEANQEDVEKGFVYVDDFPDEVLTSDDSKVVFKTTDNVLITDLTAKTYNSVDELPENIKTLLSKGAITPKGKFQIYVPVNNTDFYNKYVKTGKTIRIETPMTVKNVEDGTVFRNNGFQIDFGHTYTTNEVTNIVNKPKPKKQDLDVNGKDINNEVVPINTTNYYTLTWDLDQYRGNESSEEDINNGFYMLDDFQDDAVDTADGKVVITTESGEPVTGVTVRTYNSMAEAPENVRKAFEKANITVNGKFQLFSADNPLDFHAKYVKTGINLKVVTPMTVKLGFQGDYYNTAYQLDFNVVTATDTVKNTLVTSEPEKKNENSKGVNINNTPMQPGMTNYFKLKWDLDQFENVNVSDDIINKGFYFVDDFPEDMVDVLNENVTLRVENTTESVTGVTATIVDVEMLPQSVKDAMARKNITFSGKVQLFTADNPKDFFEKYVKAGRNIIITSPMKVKDNVLPNSEYRNKGYQIEMGIISATDTTVNTVPDVNPHKHNLNKDNVDINDTPTTKGFTNYYTLDWDLDQFRGIIATEEDNAKGFYMVDDYPEDKVTPVENAVIVTEQDGTELKTGINVTLYNSLNEAPENVRKAFEKSTFKPKGKIQVISAENPQEFYELYVRTGKNLKVVTPMKVNEDLTNDSHVYENTAYQLNYGNAYITETVVNNVPPVDPIKKNNNLEGVNINGKHVVRGMETDYRLTWDLDQYKGIKADKDIINKGFYIIDDYPEEVLELVGTPIISVDNVAINDVTVYHYNSVSEAPQELQDLLRKHNKTFTGAFQVFKANNAEDFYNKYVTTGKNIEISTHMKVKKTLENKTKEYVNKAFQLGFDTIYDTEEIPNIIPEVDPEKGNFNEDNVDINNTPLNVNGVNYYKLKWDFDQYKDMKPTMLEVLNGFHYIDDFPEEVVDINTDNVKVMYGDVDITSEVTITILDSVDKIPEPLKTTLKENNISPKGMFQLISAKSPEDFYNKYVSKGINLVIVDPMTVKEDAYGKTYSNTAYQSDFGNVYTTETVTNNVPKPKPVKKDLNTDNEDINGKVVLVGNVNKYTHTWDLEQYKGMKASKSEIAKGFYFIDDYPEEAVTILKDNIEITDSKGNKVEGITVTTYESVDVAPENIRNILSKNNQVMKGAFQVFSADNPEDFYNKYVATGETLTIVDPMQVKDEMKDSGAKYKNQSFQVEFNNLSATEIVENEVPKVTPVKKNENKDGVDINGKVMAIGMINYYKLTWDLDQFKDMKPSKEDIQKGFAFIDDYPEDVVDIIEDTITIVDSKGNKVDGIEMKTYHSVDALDSKSREAFAKWNVKPNGAFQMFIAKDPEDFYNKYVVTGETLTIVNTMRVKDGMKDVKYENTAYQWDMGVISATETVYNEVPKVTPKKENFNKNKVDINGKQVLANSVNYYTHTWDLDQYKDIEVDEETLMKGMFFVDDYPEEAVEILKDEIRFYYVDENGKENPVTEKINITDYNSIEEAPESVIKALKESGYITKGRIQVFAPENIQSFYENYVKKGISIKIVDPMKVKSEMAKVGGKYENQAYQIDFGKAHATELVYNNIPKYEIFKRVVFEGEDRNNQEIGLNKHFTYILDGAKVLGNRSDLIDSYVFVDDYQESHDRYEGNYVVRAMNDIVLHFENSVVNIKKGEYLTMYTSQMHDKEKGKVTIEFTKEFLHALGTEQDFQASVELRMERIKSGEVFNDFTNIVNGAEVLSNKVRTFTPEPPVPSRELPETNSNTHSLLYTGSLLIGLTLMLRKKYKTKI